ATSNDISTPLNVGPNPAAPPPTAEEQAAIDRGDRPAVDNDMLWMIDFDRALAQGMALKIPISSVILTAGIDSLLVFGVTRTLSATDAASQLADLLDAHHYTDGLGF